MDFVNYNLSLVEYFNFPKIQLIALLLVSYQREGGVVMAIFP
jgi:hypothetical protein